MGMDAVMTREAAIARLRRYLVKHSAEGESACRVAAECRILCGGFAHMTDAQLRARFAAITGCPPDAPRALIEEKANEWLVARQQESGAPTTCDLQRQEHEICLGWDGFSNFELAEFCLELLKIEVAVIGPEFGQRGGRRNVRSG